jgi:uncharacterized protein (TIGR02444 family)
LGWSSAGVPTPARSAAVTTGDTPFWTFSLAVYANPAVQRECLELQDDHGIDINLVLFCAFAGAAHGVALPDRAMREAADAVSAWQREVVSPLRAARGALKPFAERAPTNAPVAALRSKMKALELEAERIEQLTLERWSAGQIDSWPRTRPADAVVGNMRTLFALVQRSEEAALPQSLIAEALAVANN